MTQEDKQLLLKDLCARLPYGVKGIITYDGSNTTFTLEGIDNNVLHLSDAEECYVEDFKPYLRPMLSITKEEKEEIKPLFSKFIDEFRKIVLVVRQNKMALYQDWLNAHHFDFRNLIERDLAIAVTKENNPYRNDI